MPAANLAAARAQAKRAARHQALQRRATLSAQAFADARASLARQAEPLVSPLARGTTVATYPWARNLRLTECSSACSTKGCGCWSPDSDRAKNWSVHGANWTLLNGSTTCRAVLPAACVHANPQVRPLRRTASGKPNSFLFRRSQSIRTACGWDAARDGMTGRCCTPPPRPPSSACAGRGRRDPHDVPVGGILTPESLTILD